MDLAKIETLTRELLAAIGEDPTREGLAQTPARVAALYSSLFRGTDKDLASCIRSILPLPDSEGRTYVALRDIPFYSVCEHHFVPFFGMMSIAFAPERFTVGLGDVVRLVDLAAARLQLQERLTVEVAETIDRCLRPVALVVHVTAKHLCMDLNRDTRTHSTLRTSHYSGDLNISNQLEDAIRSSVPEREVNDLWPPPLVTTSS